MNYNLDKYMTMNVLRFAFIISFWTLISRILGLIRDIYMARILGANFNTDIFFTAFRIPNLFRRFFAEGALGVSYIPVYTEISHQNKEKSAIFAGQTIATTTWMMIGFTIFSIIFMPYLILVIAPGFSKNPEKLKLTVQLARIMFPYLLCMMLTAQLSGVLNCEKKFAAAAAAPILLNLAFLSTIFLSKIHFIAIPVIGIAWGVTISGILQVIFLSIACYYKNITIRFFLLPTFTPPIKRVFKNMIYGILSSSINQINILIGTIFSSFLGVGAISYLYYANRLIQLPLALIGIALSTALLPILSHVIQKKNINDSYSNINRSIEVCVALGSSASIGLIILSYPIIDIFFKYGAFNEENVIATAYTLEALAVGLPSLLLNRILNTISFAYQDMKTPSQVSLYIVSLNILISWILMKKMGYVGIALAISITTWINTIIMFLILLKRKQISFKAYFYLRLMKIFFSLMMMATIVFFLKKWLLSISCSLVMILLFCLFVGIITWSITLMIFGLLTKKDILLLIRKKYE